MTTVDKTVAILSTVHGYVSDEAQCEALREHLRAISMVREIPFTIHEVAMRAVGTSGTAVDKEVRVRTITEDASLCSIRFVNNVKIASAVETREVTDTQASTNAEVWLTQIGFVYCFEFFKEGFRYGVVLDGGRDGLKPMFVHVFVYKLKKLTERGNFNNLVDMSTGFMVELQCEEDVQTKDFGVRLLNFAKSLSPHIFLQEHSTR